MNEITTGTMQTFVVKKVVLPSDCTSIGDERKKQSYECEAHFYENGMASRLHELDALSLFHSTSNLEGRSRLR